MRCGICDGPPVPVLFIAVNSKFAGGQTRPEIACTKSLYFAQKALPWWSFMCKAHCWRKMGDDHSDVTPNKLGGELSGKIASPLSVADVKRDITPFRVA